MNLPSFRALGTLENDQDPRRHVMEQEPIKEWTLRERLGPLPPGFLGHLSSFPIRGVSSSIPSTYITARLGPGTPDPIEGGEERFLPLRRLP